MLASLSAPFGEPSPMEVRFEAQTGQQMLKASLSAFDPKRSFVDASTV
jgi:hypothetical protein